MRVHPRQEAPGGATVREPWPGPVPGALVLLAGSGRPTSFKRAIERSFLDLPVDSGRSVLAYWTRQAQDLGRELGAGELPVRVLLDSASAEPRMPTETDGALVTVEQDPFEHRGTAGVLSDLARERPDDEYLLVANAAQLPYRPLGELARQVMTRPSGVTLLLQQDGTPIPLLAVRCGALRRIPEVGFIDLKEQALGDIARRVGVEIVESSGDAGYSVWDLASYVESLREIHLRGSGSEGTHATPFAERWQPVFSIVEEGAHVDPGAHVLDSVVLAGARMERGSVAVRSVICGDGVVRRNQVVVDRFVAAERRGRGKAK